jgi:hypothetical protein
MSDGPWLHQASGFWCATANGRRRYLSRDHDIARRMLRQLRKRSSAGDTDRDWWQVTLAELADEYLDDVQAAWAPGTYRNNRERLARALAVLGTEVASVSSGDST